MSFADDFQPVLDAYEAGDYVRALERIDNILVRYPGHSSAIFKKSTILLALGRWREAWPLYERRTIIDPQLHLPIRRWAGENFAGQTLLIVAEQGLGDTIQFVRYAEQVRERGGRVHLACNPSQWTLVARCRGLDWVGDRIRLEDFHYFVPLLSLPGIFGTTPETATPRMPYASANPERVDDWRRELAGKPGLRVGICATGSPKNDLAPKRDIRIAHFDRLADTPGVVFYSMNPQAAAPPWAIDLGPRLVDFHETAAVLTNLDLLITCDTSIAHLAGALARPVWMCVPYVADWRWMIDREDTPWYPTMRLFRQPRPGIGRACSSASPASCCGREVEICNVRRTALKERHSQTRFRPSPTMRLFAYFICVPFILAGLGVATYGLMVLSKAARSSSWPRAEGRIGRLKVPGTFSWKKVPDTLLL